MRGKHGSARGEAPHERDEGRGRGNDALQSRDQEGAGGTRRGEAGRRAVVEGRDEASRLHDAMGEGKWCK